MLYGAFDIAPLEIRKRRGGGRRLRGRFPYRKRAILSDGGRNGRPKKESFEPGAFDFRIDDPDSEIHLLVGHDFDKPLASKKTNTLHFGTEVDNEPVPPLDGVDDVADAIDDIIPEAVATPRPAPIVRPAVAAETPNAPAAVRPAPIERPRFATPKNATALIFDAIISEEILATSYGADMLALLTSGMAIGLSPGFRIPPKRAVPNAEKIEDEGFDPANGKYNAIIRTIIQALLYEMSIVTRPAYDEAQVEMRSWDITGPIITPRPRALHRWRL